MTTFAYTLAWVLAANLFGLVWRISHQLDQTNWLLKRIDASLYIISRTKEYRDVFGAK